MRCHTLCLETRRGVQLWSDVELQTQITLRRVFLSAYAHEGANACSLGETTMCAID